MRPCKKLPKIGSFFVLLYAADKVLDDLCHLVGLLLIDEMTSCNVYLLAVAYLFNVFASVITRPESISFRLEF